MNNKVKYLVRSLIVALSLTFNANAGEIENLIFSQESYTECPLSDYDYIVADSYRYYSIGMGPVILIPNVGLGYRERFSSFGYDTALSFSTIGYAHQLSAQLAGHYYLNPNRPESYYLGFGAIGSTFFTNHGKNGVTFSPDFVFGKALKIDGHQRSFLELHVAAPTMWYARGRSDSFYIPVMFVKYGVCF